MAWLVPSIIATMAGTAVLSFCYFYLYYQDKKQFLKIWAISWSIYFTRYIFMLGIILWEKTSFLLICNQSASLISGVLLLYGSYLFVNKKFPRSFYYLAACGFLWIVISTVYNFNLMLMSLPTFSFLAGIYIWTGIIFLKSKESYQRESRAVGLAFILWGAHKANYPFLRPVVWFAPWGYLIAAILEFMVALGLLMTYFRKTKDELRSNEMKLKENQKSLVSAQRIARVGDWSWDLQTNELKWSGETFRIFGQNPETFQVSVEAFEEAIHPDDYHDFIAKRKIAVSNNKDIDIEHRIVLPNGSIRYVHQISTIIKDSQGEVVKALGTVQDITDRKLFEIELENTKEKFEKFFNTNPSATFVWKSIRDDFQLIEINESAQKLTKGNAGDFIGLKASQIYEDLPFLKEKLFDCLSGKSILEFEHHYKVRYSGKHEWVEFRLAHMAPDIVLMYTEVITQQKKAQKALIEAGKKWKNILVNTPQIGITLDTEAKIIFANERFLNLTGWKQQEVIGQNWFDLFIPEDIREEVRQVFDNAMSQKDTYDYSNYENDIITKSGELLNIAWSNVLSRDAEGNITDLTCLGVDLTERRKSENEINNQKRLFETMFNTIPDGVVITNTKREIQLANKGMEITFGYKPEEIIGKETNLLYAAQKKFEQTGKNVFGKDGKNSGDLYITRYKNKNGSEFSGETFGAKLYDEDNRWIGNLGIMRDITEREQAERRIQQAQKMESIGNLAGGIAHDFNNLLFPIVGLAEMLVEDLPPDSPEKQNANEILIAGRRGVELVQQILAFSRQHEHELSPTRLQFVIKEVLKLTRASIPKNIEIKQFLQPDCGLILADSTQLHQIGMNLITNAYHAVQDKRGKINVEVKEIEIKKGINNKSLRPGKYATLTVTDNGVGIPKENLDKILEPYFTTKEQGKGTGLGLSVVYGIVKEHKGEIKVMSEPGKSTSFQIYLPVIVSPVAKATAPDSSLLPTGTEHILLVDDELPITKLEIQMLERLGYKVDPHTSSPDALEAFKKNPDKYDLIISDMSMPKMTGKDLSEELLKIRPDIPIIICTGFSERFNKEQAQEMGIRGYLIKPVVMADMAKEIRRVLDASK